MRYPTRLPDKNPVSQEGTTCCLGDFGKEYDG